MLLPVTAGLPLDGGGVSSVGGGRGGVGAGIAAPSVSETLFVQRDPGGLAQGFVDLDLGCPTILLGQ